MENFLNNILNYINNFLENIINFDYIGFLSSIFSMLTFENFLKLIIIYFFIVWIAIIVWVTRDIINRTNNIFLQILSIFTVLLGTPLGIVVYLLIRPSKTLFEQYCEEVSLENDEDIQDIHSIKQDKFNLDKNISFCYNCSYPINPEYKFCPNCRIQLKAECIKCNKELDPKWTICPYCGCDQEKKVEKILNYSNNINEIFNNSK